MEIDIKSTLEQIRQLSEDHFNSTSSNVAKAKFLRVKNITQELQSLGLQKWRLHVVSKAQHYNAPVISAPQEAIESMIESAVDTAIEDAKTGLEESPETRDDYQSNTFKCKSDCEKCVKDAKDWLGKLACKLLLIRCVLKG